MLTLVDGQTTPLPDEGQVTVTVGDVSPDEYAARQARADDDAIIRECVARWKVSNEAEARLRQEMAKDLDFLAGNHWPSTIRTAREQDGRPCLTVNKLPQYVNQVTNQQRQAKPAIQIGPVDSAADIETARIYQGIIRNIEVNSRAEMAYGRACQDQVGLGRGWWMITAEYDDGATSGSEAVRQHLAIKGVRNRFRVYPDPTCQEPDYSDALFLVDVVDLPRTSFEAAYGKEAAQRQADFELTGLAHLEWVAKETVRVARYWRVVETMRTLHRLGDQVVEDGPLQAMLQASGLTLAEARAQGRVQTLRTIKDRTVEWYLLTSALILERGVWPGRYIPYIPVLGIELDVNGTVDLRGIVRDARDSQMRYDVQVSSEIEAIGLMPKAPWVGYKGQFTDPKWKDANQRNYAYLEAELVDANGERVPLPQRTFGEPAIRAIAESIMRADADLRAVTGYYDQFPGETVGAERSGRAILARQRQGELGNSHFIGNLARAIVFTGRQLVDLIPHYYDQFQIVRILGDDNKPMEVGVYSGDANKPAAETPVPTTVQHVKDLGVGRYDVTIKMGKSYESSREEQAEALTALAQAAPPLVPQFADLWIGSQDWPNAQEIAKRLTPPQFQPDNGQPIPPKVKAQMDALMQQHEQLAQALNQATEQLQGKKLELESKERIAQMQTEAQVAIAALQSKTTQDVAGLKHRIDTIYAAMDANKLEIDRVSAAHEIARDARDFESAQNPGSSGAPNPPTPASAPAGSPGVPFEGAV